MRRELTASEALTSPSDSCKKVRRTEDMTLKVNKNADAVPKIGEAGTKKSKA